MKITRLELWLFALTTFALLFLFALNGRYRNALGGSAFIDAWSGTVYSLDGTSATIPLKAQPLLPRPTEKAESTNTLQAVPAEEKRDMPLPIFNE